VIDDGGLVLMVEKVEVNQSSKAILQVQGQGEEL